MLCSVTFLHYYRSAQDSAGDLREKLERSQRRLNKAQTQKLEATKQLSEMKQKQSDDEKVWKYFKHVLILTHMC